MVEFCLYPILNVLISNVTLAFGNFESRSLNMGILGQKNISFLMLMKFWLYPILKVLILNLTFIFNDFEPESPNLKTLTKKNELFSFNKILPLLFQSCWFKIWHLLSVVLSTLLPRIHEPIQCLCFPTYLEKVLIANKALRKSKNILSLTILRF